jgi:hypothetical protein
MVLSFVSGAMFCIGALAFALGAGDAAFLNDSPLGSWAAPVQAAVLFLAGAVLILIAVGLRSRQPWARPLMIGFWAVLALGNIAAFVIQVQRRDPRWRSDLTPVCALLVATWYLFGKQNVTAYFGELKTNRQA